MRSSLEETETKKTGTLSDGQRTVEIESETEKRDIISWAEVGG
jgi:hypothetical protein